MADELARINLLTDTRATLEAITEDGTPGIATNYSHRLGWLSGGSFRWGAMRDTDERFASVTVSNAVSGLLKTDGLKKIVSSDIFSESGGLGYASNLSVSDLTSGFYPLAGASGRLANSSLSEDATSVNSAKPVVCRASEPVMSGITASTAGLSYSNSTTPTSIIAAGEKTIEAGRWGVAGTTWMGLFMGTIQWTNAHTLRFEVLLGATVIADSGAITMSAISSGSIWSLTLYGTLRTVGASGTLQIDGVFRCTESGGLVGIKGFAVNTPSPVAIDTTISNTINVRVTAGTASTGNILATRTFHFSGI